MAMKAADLLHVGRGTFLLDRLQNAGPSGLNIPTEVIKELGNYKSVATVRDTPDLTFSAQSFDVTTELERMLTGYAASGALPVGGLDLTSCTTLDVVGMIKPGASASAPFDALRSVACPLLYPERVSYRFAVQANSTVDITLRGDSIYYAPGTAYVQSALGAALVAGALELSHPAGIYTNNGADTRVLAVSLNGQRQVEGTDFTVTVDTGQETEAYATGTTVTFAVAPAASDKVSVTYFSNAIASFPQVTHPTASAKPAAVKGRGIRVYIGGFNATDPGSSAGNRWSGVQSATVEWAVSVAKDYELGNANATTVEAEDVPTVNGTVSLRARNSAELFTRLRQITGVTDVNKAIGPDNAVELPLDILVLDSEGYAHKRLHVPDARFSLPGYNAQVGQRVDLELNYTSDSGTLMVFEDGDLPWS